jgi:hypothetical protein
MDTIHIAAGDYTQGLKKRQIGKLNVGVYCKCGEFIAFAVTDPRMKGKVALACDGPLSFSCPFCHDLQKAVVTEFQELILTEGNKRRSAR